MSTFSTTIAVRWSDVDQNRHVRHSAYYDYGAHARIRFFMEIGYSPSQMDGLNIGPILFKESCSFIKEIRLEDTIRVNLLKEDVREDGARWLLHHELYNQHDEKVAHITIQGAWMDLEKRRLTIPPKALADGFHSLTEGKAYSYKPST